MNITLKNGQNMISLKSIKMILAFFILSLFYYFFSFLIPFTNNAFVIANIRPVAAIVHGYISELNIKNEQYVKKGEKLFTVYQAPYRLKFQETKQNLLKANEDYLGLFFKLKKDQELLNKFTQAYQRIHLNYIRNRSVLNFGAVSEIKVKDLKFADNAALAKVLSQKQQILLDKQNIKSMSHQIKLLQSQKELAKIYLKQTEVYAQADGQIQNMFLSVGTPIKVNQPVFSFIDTKDIFIQANFNELDLRKVKKGNQVYIIPRIYFATKIYHGEVISSHGWAANRQNTNPKSQLQNLKNNTNNWILLPQRFPVQIRILDYDPENYPLPIGASCYVFIAI